MTTSMTDQTAATANLDLTIQRHFNAPRELVFKAWTEPERLMRWLAAPGASAAPATIDLRVDGSWRAAVVTPDGTQHWTHGRYVEIDAPERLVFTFAWEGEPEYDTLITITLAEQQGQTEMTFNHATFRTIDERNDHSEGWNSCLDQLAAYLAA